MTKWIFGALLGLFFSQPVVANEALEYEIELTDENGNVHSQSVMLDVRNGEAYFEGDIFLSDGIFLKAYPRPIVRQEWVPCDPVNPGHCLEIP